MLLPPHCSAVVLQARAEIDALVCIDRRGVGDSATISLSPGVTRRKVLIEVLPHGAGQSRREKRRKRRKGLPTGERTKSLQKENLHWDPTSLNEAAKAKQLRKASLPRLRVSRPVLLSYVITVTPAHGLSFTGCQECHPYVLFPLPLHCHSTGHHPRQEHPSRGPACEVTGARSRSPGVLWTPPSTSPHPIQSMSSSPARTDASASYMIDVRHVTDILEELDVGGSRGAASPAFHGHSATVRVTQLFRAVAAFSGRGGGMLSLAPGDLVAIATSQERRCAQALQAVSPPATHGGMVLMCTRGVRVLSQRTALRRSRKRKRSLCVRQTRVECPL